jgi:hypothetical protein
MTNFEGAVGYTELRDMPLPELEVLFEECERIGKARERAMKRNG